MNSILQTILVLNMVNKVISRPIVQIMRTKREGANKKIERKDKARRAYITWKNNDDSSSTSSSKEE